MDTHGDHWGDLLACQDENRLSYIGHYLSKYLWQQQCYLVRLCKSKLINLSETNDNDVNGVIKKPDIDNLTTRVL